MDYYWNLNTDAKRRDNIIFGEGNADKMPCYGGIRRFENVTLKQLIQLRDENFLNPDECQNLAPSIKEIMEFMEEHEGFTAHGYTVSPDRNDYRISIEGVEKTGNLTAEDVEDFTEMFRKADEFAMNDNYLYCWYD